MSGDGKSRVSGRFAAGAVEQAELLNVYSQLVSRKPVYAPCQIALQRAYIVRWQVALDREHDVVRIPSSAEGGR